MAARFSSSVFVVLLSAIAALLASASCASGGDQPPLPLGGDDAGATFEGGGAPACHADLGSDPQNCGACGKACAAGESCHQGVCINTCPAQQTMCPGGCANLTNDPSNCGACGTTCVAAASAGAKAVCSAGQCTFDCGSGGGTACSDGCYDLKTSANNCGSCGFSCGAGQTCQNGVCCGGGSKICNGACVDVSQDPANCGDCAHACAKGGQCAAGVCAGYASAAATTPFVDACTLSGHQTLLASTTGWEASAPVPLPFDVAFFGSKQTQLWIGSQGTLGFGASPPSSSLGYPTCPLPDSFNAYGAIVAFGDSIDTSASGVCWGTTGTAPNRQLVVTWSKATHESDPGSVLTFSVLVAETGGAVDVVYQTATPGTGGGGYVRGNSATVGLQDPTGKIAAQFACGSGSNDLYNSTPYAVRFTPLQ
jgi:hypothetical protein